MEFKVIDAPLGDGRGRPRKQLYKDMAQQLSSIESGKAIVVEVPENIKIASFGALIHNAFRHGSVKSYGFGINTRKVSERELAVWVKK